MASDPASAVHLALARDLYSCFGYKPNGIDLEIEYGEENTGYLVDRLDENDSGIIAESKYLNDEAHFARLALTANELSI